MNWDRNKDSYEFEARIEFSTAKAYLVEPTIGEQTWLPKSQVLKQSEPDVDGNVTFTVTAWWAGKNGFTT